MFRFSIALVTAFLLIAPGSRPSRPSVPLPSAPASAFYFVGNGSNIVYVDQENDVVAVIRWIRGGDALNQVVGKILAAIDEPSH